jgi:hypothetical protein
MIKLTLEDLGLEMFHDQWARVKLWRMEENYRLEEYSKIITNPSIPYILKNKRCRKAYGMRQLKYKWREIGEALDVSGERARQMAGKYERALKRTGEYAP